MPIFSIAIVYQLPTDKSIVQSIYSTPLLDKPKQKYALKNVKIIFYEEIQPSVCLYITISIHLKMIMFIESKMGVDILYISN